MPYAATGEQSTKLLLASMGLETTIGTAISPTFLIPALKWDLKPLTAAVPEPAWGSFYGNRTNLNVFQTGASASVEYYAAAETLGPMLSAFFGADTYAAGPPKTHTWLAPYRTTIATGSKKTLTLYEANMDSVSGYAYMATGMWGQKFSLKAESNKPLVFAADLLGKRYETSTQGTADGGPFATPPTTTLLTGNGLTLFRNNIDVAATTAWFPSSYAFELNVDTGREPNQELGFMEQQAEQPYLEGDWANITCSLTMARNVANKTLYDYLVGASPAAQKDSLKFLFTTSANAALSIELGAAILTTPAVDRGGKNERLTVTWQGYTDTTLLTPLKMVLTNEQASIT